MPKVHQDMTVCELGLICIVLGGNALRLERLRGAIQGEIATINDRALTVGCREVARKTLQTLRDEERKLAGEIRDIHRAMIHRYGFGSSYWGSGQAQRDAAEAAIAKLLAGSEGSESAESVQSVAAKH